MLGEVRESEDKGWEKWDQTRTIRLRPWSGAAFLRASLTIRRGAKSVLPVVRHFD